MAKHVIFIGLGKPTFPIPKQYIALGEELARRGHEVHLLLHHQRPLEEQSGNPMVHYWHWDQKSLLHYYWSDIVYTMRMIRRYKPRAVISGHRQTRMLVVMAWLLGVPVRVLYHHTLATQTELDSRKSATRVKLDRWLRSLIYRTTATHMVGVSSAAVRDLVENYHFPAERAVLLCNLIDDPAAALAGAEPMLIGSAAARILCVGRLDHSKGQDVLIRSIPLMLARFPDLKATFVGQGNAEAKLKALVAELQLESHCQFVGAVSHSVVTQYMQAASITICPSRMDNLPTVVIESLSVGTPVVVSDVGGARDILADGEGGYLVPPDDPDRLAGKIMALLDDPDQLAELSKIGRSHFLEKFEIKHAISHYADQVELDFGLR